MARTVAVAPGRRRDWRTLCDTHWEIGRPGSGRWAVIPAGREFEVSVPRALRWFISPDDPRWHLAALVHDWMLESGIFGRPQAAAEFYDGALAGGAPRWKARLAFVAVAAWAVYIPGASSEDGEARLGA